MPDILLVDDHLVITTGLEIVISKFFPRFKTDMAFDGNSAFDKIKRNNYELIIMDISLPNTDSYVLINNILAVKPGSRILMFSMNSEEMFAKRYLQMGAMGYVSKDAPLDNLRNAIESILENKRYLSREMKEKLSIEALGEVNQENDIDKLSPREFEIFQHLILGDTVSEISEKLNLHTSTIGTHKARIFEKLHCHNIVELLAIAKLNNIVV